MTIRNLDALLRADAVVWVGAAESALAHRMIENLRACGTKLVETGEALGGWPGGMQRVTAVLASESAATAQTVARLGERGCRAVIWPLPQPPSQDVLDQARSFNLRLLGPRSGGIVHSGARFNASGFAAPVGSGKLALIAQSQSVAAAALDWAAGRQLGFSWVATTGGECDIDVADLLDFATLDGQTRGVVVQLSSIRGARKFMSAARACARLKPVVVLQTRRSGEATAGPDPVRSAAFARSGLVECDSLPALFDAIVALQRLPALRDPRILVIGNGAGICALGADALRRQGLAPFLLDEAAIGRVRAHHPPVRFSAGAIDLGPCAAHVQVAVLAEILADARVSAVLLVHSPVAGSSHEAMVRALRDTRPNERLLTVWLGLATALPARAQCADDRISTFTSPDAAARALRYRWHYHRNRELLTQTPPAEALPAADGVAIHRVLAAYPADAVLAPRHVQRVLAAYGLEPAPKRVPGGVRLGLALRMHPELGMHLQLRVAQPFDPRPPAYAFAPLDALLAGRLLDELGLTFDQVDQATRIALQGALIRIARLPIEQTLLGEAELALVAAGGSVGCETGAVLRVAARPVPPRQRLALAPYPDRASHVAAMSDGRRYAVRAVRPADEPAVIGLLERLDPEEIRLRFFSYIRHFSHELGARMTQIDYDREQVLVASPADADEVVAIATLISDPDGREAEFAVLVHHDHTGCGLGRHLMEQLLAHARAQGIAGVFGTVLAENEPMLALAQRLGFQARRDPEERGCIRVTISTAAGESPAASTRRTEGAAHG